MPETICLATFKGVGDTLGGNCRHVDDDQPGNSTLNRRWSWTVLGWEFHRFLLLVLVGTRIPLSIWLSYITKESWSHQVGIPPFSGFTGCMHAPLNQTLLHCKSFEVIRWEFHRSLVLLVVRMPLSIWLLHCKSLEVIRWESLPFCCCTGTCIPLSTLLSYMTKSVFESDSRNPRIPLSSLVRYSTGQQTFGDNRVHPFVTVVVHISLSLSLNFTLLQDQSCGQFQVGTPPLSLL